MRTVSNFGIFLLCIALYVSCKTLQETPSPIIQLTSNVPAGATANGKSTYRFTATVNPSVSEEYRIVTFKTSGGFLANTDSSTVQYVRINERGEATSDWVVPKVGGNYFVSASIGTGINIYEQQIRVTLQDSIPPTVVEPPVIPDTILVSIPGTDTVRADGQSLLRIDLALKNPNPKQLIVANNSGTLSDGTAIGIATNVKSLTVQLDNAGKGEAYLKLGTTVEPYFVRAYVSTDQTAFKLISFTPQRAYPDNIYLEADSNFVRPNSQTPLSVFLTRNVGKVSIGTRIDYEVYQDFDGNRRTLDLLKNVANNLSNDQGRAAVVFVADTTVADRNRPVYVKASSRNDRGQTISKEIMLHLKQR